MRGRVKFINEDKGYGFITTSGSTNDVFVHSSGLIDEICERDIVEFDILDRDKGPAAINVRVLETELD